MGKLNISRGSELEEGRDSPRLELVPRTASSDDRHATGPRSAWSGGYSPVHDRLDALERLASLHERGIVSAEEFVLEKAVILMVPGGHPLVVEAGPRSVRRSPGRPSLIGRLLTWRLIPVGLVAGLALSIAAQPDETSRLFDELLRLFGA